MRKFVFAAIFTTSLLLFACGEAEQQPDVEEIVELTEESPEVTEALIEEVAVEVEVEEAVEEEWPETTLPEPWPQNFFVLDGMDVVSENNVDGNLVFVGSYADDTEPGVWDSYDFYYAGFPGWSVPEDMGMSCMSDGGSLTVILGGEEGTILIDGNYVEGLLTMTYTLTPQI